MRKTAPVPEREYGSVNFCAHSTPFLRTTYQKGLEFYADYKKSLGETSLQEVTDTVDKIVSDTGHSSDIVDEDLSILKKSLQRSFYERLTDFIGSIFS